MLCCNFPEMVGSPLPFKRAIAIEYGQDRAISGIVKCDSHGTVYRFAQLDYHTLDEISVYGLGMIAEDYYAALHKAYSKFAKPRWPIWVPPTETQIPIAQYESITQLEDTIWSHGKFEIIIAAKNIVNCTIRAASKVNGHTDNWMEVIGL